MEQPERIAGSGITVSSEAEVLLSKKTGNGNVLPLTLLRTDEGRLYLAVCGHVPLLAGLLRHAWRRKRPRNVIVHTDRGDQYCSVNYQALLKQHNLRGSMSTKGCCYDNACVESSFIH